MRSYPYHPDALGAAALAHRKLRALDAYEDNPLWQEYVKKDIIAKDKRGTPPKGEMMGDLQSCQLSYAREWETGCAKRRIDSLLKMLPELKGAHTIHIDVFDTYPPVPHTYPEGRYPDRDYGFKGISPWLGFGPERESAAQQKTIRYFRDYGLEVTSGGSTSRCRSISARTATRCACSGRSIISTKT